MSKKSKILIAVVLIALCSLFYFVINDSKFKAEFETEEILENSDENLNNNDENSLYESVDDIVRALEEKDFETLAIYVHPERGLRFSSSEYISIANDKIFTPEEVENLFSNNKKYVWGLSDGSGIPIELTFADYYKKFVYSAKFSEAENVSFTDPIGVGNTTNNMRDVYDNAKVVELHFSGFNEKYKGMDWQSLYLVLEEIEGDLYLVGIAHGAWSI